MVGLSLSATVVQQSLRTQLQGQLNYGGDADRIIKKVRESLDYIKTLDPKTREIVRGCYGIATTNGFGFMLGVVSIAMLSSCTLRMLYAMCTKANRRYHTRVHQGEKAQQIATLFGIFVLSCYDHLIASIHKFVKSKNL